MYKDKNVSYFADDIRLLVAYPAHVYQPIVDVALAIYNSFFDCDIDVELKPITSTRDLNSVAMSNTYSHILCINVHDFLKKDEVFYLERPKMTKLLCYNLEQSSIEGQNSFWASMRLNQVGVYGSYFDFVVTESKNKDTDLRRLGLRTLNLNIPYHECLDMNVDPYVEKEYDVVFIGCGNDRRKQLIDDIGSSGIKFAPVPLPNALSKEYKSQVINKTKLCINVHFSEMEYFEKPRIMYDYFMNKGLVVSEKIKDPEVFKHTEDFFMASYGNMLPMILILLNKYDDSFVEKGISTYNKFKTEYHYEKVIPSFINQLYSKQFIGA